ncbi:MAG: hypothetical protein LRY73_00970 [Bacillus sp. (in: Bacteria)]|nr:hypothetical protein [Bacillus sp. (in: firmicutes)]
MKNQWEIDRVNDRLVAFFPDLGKGELSEIITVFKREDLGKLIVHVLESDNVVMEQAGFQREGELSGFFLQ